MLFVDPKPCLNCSAAFSPRRKTNVYCCRTCQVSYLRKIGKIKGRQAKGVLLNCKLCDSGFYVPQYRADTAKFCSRRCTSLANPENTQKAREASPVTRRAQALKGGSGRKIYKTISVNGKEVREHRWLMEQYLGRKLESWEHVHHIDDNHLNNDIENLEVLSNSEHQRKELSKWQAKDDL